jgi:hypothetical protein
MASCVYRKHCFAGRYCLGASGKAATKGEPVGVSPGQFGWCFVRGLTPADAHRLAKNANTPRGLRDSQLLATQWETEPDRSGIITDASNPAIDGRGNAYGR